MNKFCFQPFRHKPRLAFVEAKNLRVGRADKADAKNTTRSEARCGDFLKRHLHGLGRRRGVDLPQQRSNESIFKKPNAAPGQAASINPIIVGRIGNCLPG